VNNVIVFEDEIKVVLKILLVTIGGGGPYYKETTGTSSTSLSLLFTKTRK